MLNIDILQRLKVCGLFFLQFYKITTGTLLTLFIPQKCENNLINSTEIYQCSIIDNYENNDNYFQKTLYWNIITMNLFLFTYFLELKRENWAIEYLDIDHDKPDNALKETIKKYPELDKKMDQINYYYYSIIKICIFSYFINLLLSIKIINERYYSSSTTSCFISFSLLVLMKLYNSFHVAKLSVKEDKILSAYLNEPVSFNILDKDHYNP
tara:strand:+ start:3134 stop:3766 length:633 start_codon:yes stop_codon:yes gene_type:complete